MAKKMHDTPMLDALETGPWPSFVTGLKRLAKDKDYVVDPARSACSATAAASSRASPS